MGKFWLVLSVLFLIPIALSYDFNFISNYTLNTFQTRDRIKCYFDSASSHWFCSYIKTSDKKLYVEEFDKFFISQATDSALCHDASGCHSGDCNFISYSINGSTIECLGREDDASPGSELFQFDISAGTLTPITLFDNTGSDDWLKIGQVNDYYSSTGSMKVWYKSATEPQPQYTTANTISGSGSGTWTLPVNYRGYPDDLQLAYCNGFYYMFLVNATTDKLNVLSFNTDRDYTGKSWVLNSNWQYIDDAFGVWVDKNEDVIYLASTNTTGEDSEKGLLQLESYSCDALGNIALNNFDLFNQSYFEPTVNYTATKFVYKPFLTKDDDGVFHLFYEFRSGASYSTRAWVEGSDCSSCSSWSPQEECVLGKQKYIRNCPAGSICTNTTYWAETSFCGKEYNKTLGVYEQNYTNYYNVTSCETEWFKTGEGVASCSPLDIKIPSDCQNITVEEEAVPFFEAGTEVGCEQGRFYLTSCTPNFDCFTGNYSCTQLNASLIKPGSYSAGDTATGSSSLTVDPMCKCRFAFFNTGVQRFKLMETLKVSCNKPCRNEWFCKNEDYTALRQIDCTDTNQTFCNSGCDYATGKCSVSKDTVNDGFNPGGALKFFTDPTPNQKILTALAGCGVFTVIGIAVSDRRNFLIPLVFLAFGWILFTVIHYIPGVFTILIVFFVGFGFWFKNKS